jgi:hypothetical protein
MTLVHGLTTLHLLFLRLQTQKYAQWYGKSTALIGGIEKNVLFYEKNFMPRYSILN